MLVGTGVIVHLRHLGFRDFVAEDADHGDAFGEHGIYSDHVCADECIHHIPLIVRWPRVLGTVPVEPDS